METREIQLKDYNGNKVIKEYAEDGKIYYWYVTQDDDLINIYTSLEALKKDNKRG